MAKFGVAFVEVKADLSGFGKGLGKEIEARLGDVNVNDQVERQLRPKFAGVGKTLAEAVSQQTGEELQKTVREALDTIDSQPRRRTAEVDLDIRRFQSEAAVIRAEIADLGRQKPTVEVQARTEAAKLALDEIRVKVARLRTEKAEIKVDVDHSNLDLLRDAGSNIGQALHGIAISLGGLLGIGGALTGIGQAAAAALPVVIALGIGIGILAASFGAAVAGAAALGVALAGVLGPAVIVALAALAKIATIIKAIHTDSQAGAASTSAVAAANDQLANATAGLASAQTNLKQQTSAAYTAWADAIERVKDDLLGVQDAQLGIEDAQLSLREATQALKEFKAQVGGPSLDNVFKKFTDVNVDMSGLKKALADARDARGKALSGDDQLKLERLILNIRRAKLQEKHATDNLHDANVQLQRDRKTEADYVRNGIRAYPGYISAVQGVAQAKRSEASARRAVASAATAEAGALGKLSPVEQKLAATFKLISKAFNKALAPAITALFGGLNRGLRIFAAVLADPKIIRALRGIGAAMGDAFVTLAKLFATKKMRDAFVTLANGAAKLIRVVGGKAFPAFVKILMAIATAALPSLVKLFSSAADTLDRWATWIAKHPKEFNDHLLKLIDTTFKWLNALVDIGNFLIELGGFFNRLGANVGRIFQQGKQAISDFFAQFEVKNDNIRDLGLALGGLGKAAEFLWKVSLPPLKRILRSIGQVFNGVVELIAGIVEGDWKKAWTGAKDIAIGAIKLILNFFGFITAPFRKAGSRLGKAFSGAFRTALSGIKGAAQAVVNALIDIINFGIRKIDKILGPRNLGPLGHTPDLRIGQVGHVDFTSDKRKSLNPGKLPSLTKKPTSIRATNKDSAAFQQVIEHVDIGVTSPPGTVPDGTFTARQIMLQLARVGG